jgi:hypothetical protein
MFAPPALLLWRCFALPRNPSFGFRGVARGLFDKFWKVNRTGYGLASNTKGASKGVRSSTLLPSFDFGVGR